MQAFQTPNDYISSRNLSGPVDLYAALLTVKNGFGNGVTKLGCYTITKAEAKRAGIDWFFVEKSVQILGLKIANRAGRNGHCISN